MFDLLKIRAAMGNLAIPDIRKARPAKPFRGFPALDGSRCGDCTQCAGVCPTGAITTSPLRIDLGKCLLCGDCAAACPPGAIAFTNTPRLAATSRDRLVIDGETRAENYERAACVSRTEIHRLFGRSLKLRSVSAGGCNSCEMELNACGNVNFDMGRFGIDVVASPRHADGLVVTGPVSRTMSDALEDTWRAIPEPKILIAAGACAISGGIFSASDAVDRSFFDRHPVDLFIPGCPFHPLTFVNGVLDFIGRK